MSGNGPFKAYRTASGKSVLQMLTEFGNKAEVSLGKQLYREATGIVEAARGLTPVDTSTLRSALGVAEPERDGNVITVEMGVGGPAGDKLNEKTGEMASSYALHVHEDLEAFHKVGTAKFLEMPFNAAKKGMAARIAAGMKADMAGAGPAADMESLGDPEV